jgi:hypothetical protein
MRVSGLFLRFCVKRFYGVPKSYACFACCGSETTFKVVFERTQTLQEIRESYTHGLDWRDVARNDQAMTPDQLKQYRDWRPPRRGGYRADVPATYDAVRIKKSRLSKTAKTIVSFHGNRVRFLTVTCRENIRDKKRFLYELENIRKALAKIGIVLKYSGMLEKQDGKRRKDGRGRGAWHLHCLCYTLDHDLDYKKIQGVAVSRGFNFDFQRLGKARRTSKKIASYMSKLESVAIAAYSSKGSGGDVHCYTLTSKGCDLPNHRKMYDVQNAWDFIQNKGFSKKSVNERFVYWLTENEKFSKEFYKNGFNDTC